MIALSSNRASELRVKLLGLLSGVVKPTAIIGGGYQNPRMSAGSYLNRVIYNTENPNSAVDFVSVSSNGHGYKSENSAMRSKEYKLLIAATENQTIMDSGVLVKKVGVMPDSLGFGFMIYATFDTL